MDLRGVGCGHGLDRHGSGQGQVANPCECGNEISSFIKCGEFLDQVRNSDPWSSALILVPFSHRIKWNHKYFLTLRSLSLVCIYIHTHVVPHREHSVFPLGSLISENCVRRYSRFIVRNIKNTQILRVDKIEWFLVL